MLDFLRDKVPKIGGRFRDWVTDNRRVITRKDILYTAQHKFAIANLPATPLREEAFLRG